MRALKILAIIVFVLAVSVGGFFWYAVTSAMYFDDSLTLQYDAEAFAHVEDDFERVENGEPGQYSFTEQELRSYFIEHALEERSDISGLELELDDGEVTLKCNIESEDLKHDLARDMPRLAKRIDKGITVTVKAGVQAKDGKLLIDFDNVKIGKMVVPVKTFMRIAETFANPNDVDDIEDGKLYVELNNTYIDKLRIDNGKIEADIK